MYRISLALPKNKFTLCRGRFFAPLRMTNLCKPVGAIHEAPEHGWISQITNGNEQFVGADAFIRPQKTAQTNGGTQPRVGAIHESPAEV